MGAQAKPRYTRLGEKWLKAAGSGSLSCRGREAQSTVSAWILGGVPVFSRPTSKPRSLRDPESREAAISPRGPETNRVRPMCTTPDR